MLTVALLIPRNVMRAIRREFLNGSVTVRTLVGGGNEWWGDEMTRGFALRERHATRAAQGAS